MNKQQPLSQAIRRREALQIRLGALRAQRRAVLHELREVLTALSWIVVVSRRQPQNVLVSALEMRRVGLRWDLFAIDNEIQLVEADLGLAGLAIGDVVIRIGSIDCALRDDPPVSTRLQLERERAYLLDVPEEQYREERQRLIAQAQEPAPSLSV